MGVSRRRFLEAAGAGVASAGLGQWLGCSRASTPPAERLSGAPGVDVLYSGTGLPDYSHDLVNYLVRVTGEARERRQQIVRAISTPDGVRARQKTITADLWKML